MEQPEIIRLPAGESGALVGKLTQRNIEAIARVFALPEPVRRKRYGTDDQVVGYLARSLGISPAFVRRAKGDRRVKAQLWQKVSESLDYLMPTLIYHQVELAMPPFRDNKAFRSIAELAGRLKGGGVNVQTNVGVNVTVPGRPDGGIAEDMENLSKLRAMREDGTLDRLLGRVEPA